MIGDMLSSYEATCREDHQKRVSTFELRKSANIRFLLQHYTTCALCNKEYSSTLVRKAKHGTIRQYYKEPQFRLHVNCVERSGEKWRPSCISRDAEREGHAYAAGLSAI
jgi:hypothetical protein